MVRDKPLCLGKLASHSNGIRTLMGEQGHIKYLTEQEYEVIRNMTGFQSFEDISAKTGYKIEVIKQVFKKFRGDKFISFLSEWNKLYWCSSCQVYLLDCQICPSCNHAAKYVPLLPPCDPWMCFNEEYRFLEETLSQNFNIILPKNAFLMGNTGLINGTYFWEIICEGKVILQLDFLGASQKDWKIRLYPAAKELSGKHLPFDSYVRKLLRYNKNRLESLTLNSLAFIEETTGICRTIPLVYFSGGKESMVMLDLFSKLKKEANLLFVDPGVSFPDTVKFLNELKHKIEKIPFLHFYTYSIDFENVLKILSKKEKLTAEDPWCRNELKNPLKRRAIEEIYGAKNFVAFEGSRWYENDFRRRHPRINFIKSENTDLWVHPIAEFTSLDVWLYIFKNKLKVDPAYHKGFQRTTCWLCPVVPPFHMKCSQKYYPEWWRKIEKYDCQLIGFESGDNRDVPF